MNSNTIEFAPGISLDTEEVINAIGEDKTKIVQAFLAEVFGARDEFWEIEIEYVNYVAYIPEVWIHNSVLVKVPDNSREIVMEMIDENLLKKKMIYNQSYVSVHLSSLITTVGQAKGEHND